MIDMSLWGTRLRDQEDALQAKMVPETQSYYPFALLGQEGWEALDPFLPMEVGRYTSQVVMLALKHCVFEKQRNMHLTNGYWS